MLNVLIVGASPERVSLPRGTFDLRIAVDGGIRSLPRPDLWIGDGDSSPKKIRARESIRLKRDKDLSDFGCALEWLSAQKFSEFSCVCAGFLGGRRDQEWAAFLDASRFVKRWAPRIDEFKFVGARNSVWVLAGRKAPWTSRDWKVRTRLSLLPTLGSARGVRLAGLKYTRLSGKVLTPSSQGLSNRINVQRPTVLIGSGAVLAVVSGC